MQRFVQLAVIVLLILGGHAFAQEAQPPVVQIALFYSPTCPHCHDVIDNVLPGIEARYGDQVEIYFINVSEQAGAMMIYDACDALSIPENRCGSVPTMVIGRDVLIGSVEIPSQMPRLINARLAEGGSDLSALPLIWRALQANQTAANTTPTASTFADRYATDVLGNSTAVAVLFGLVMSFVLIFFAGVKAWTGKLVQWITGDIPRILAVAGLGGGVIVISGVIFSANGFPALLAIAIAILLIFTTIAVYLTGSLGRKQTRQRWSRVIPLVILAGIITAGYLSYIETTHTEAVCGVVGDCNAVQASPYASLFGIPIGVIGVVGYMLMLIAWWVGQQRTTWATLGKAGLFLLAFGGGGFSAYLTFLEPFVIGAVCTWCITSALIILALMWLTAEDGLTALKTLAEQTSADKSTKRIYISGQ